MPPRPPLRTGVLATRLLMSPAIVLKTSDLSSAAWSDSGFRLPCVCPRRWQWWNSLVHDVGRLCLQRSKGHVLDELPVPGCNDDDAMLLVRARDSWVVSDIRSMSSLHLVVHVEP